MEAYDTLGRPCKDLYNMKLCFGIRERSADQSSKCGCRAVGDDNGIITEGYNSPVMGSDDFNIPQERPDRYAFMVHSEINGICNAAKKGHSLNNCIFYITGFPCIECLRAIIQVGCKKVIYGPYQVNMIKDLSNYPKLLKNQKIIIERFKYDEALFEAIKGLKEECLNRPVINFEWNV